MRRYLHCTVVFITAAVAVSCSVMSQSIREEAGAPIPFRTLQKSPETYVGRTVILGGYVIEVRNLNDVTKLLVLQSPLKSREEPKPRDASEGRFMAVYEGFLDPAVYAKDRKVTVAGAVTGVTRESVNEQSYSYLTLSLQEIHLWEKEIVSRPPPYYYDPWWPYYRPWRRYPYHRYRPYYW